MRVSSEAFDWLQIKRFENVMLLVLCRFDDCPSTVDTIQQKFRVSASFCVYRTTESLARLPVMPLFSFICVLFFLPRHARLTPVGASSVLASARPSRLECRHPLAHLRPHSTTIPRLSGNNSPYLCCDREICQLRGHKSKKKHNEMREKLYELPAKNA